MSYEAFRAAVSDPALLAVAQHWDAARAGRSMPAWRDIDPAAIRQHLAIVWAWRWDDALGTFVGRLAGEEIVAVLGRNIHGRRLDECFRPEAHGAVFARYKRVIAEPALMHSHGKVHRAFGGLGQGERIVLPLAADGVHGDGIFGATTYRLGIRPTSGETFAIDHLGETVEFYSLGSRIDNSISSANGTDR